MSKATSLSLFRLITSMSKAEKRHFKLSVRQSRNETKMNYMRLFDAIEKQKKYNEERIIRLSIVKRDHLPMLKNYLHNLILENMQMLRNRADDIDTKLLRMLQHARTMQSKGISDGELKFLTKAKDLSLKYERWIIALEALQQIRKLMTREEKSVTVVDQEISLALNKFSNLHDYLKIQNNVNDHLKKSEMQRGSRKKALKKLMAHPLFRDERKQLSAEAKRMHYLTLNQYYYFIGDYKTFYWLSLKNVRFVEDSLATLEFPESAYSSALNNLTIAQCILKKYPDALATISKHRSVIKKDAKAMTHAFMCSTINETNYYLTTGHFEKGVASIENLEKELKKFQPEIPYTQQVSLYFNAAYLCFSVNDFHNALKWINKIINPSPSDFREDLQVWAHILRILIHYELRTPGILPHLIVTTYRFLLKRKQLHKVEKSILLFIRRVGKTRKRPQHKELVTEFRKFRDELIQITKDPREKKALHYFDLVSWLESKLEKRAFAAIVKEKTLPAIKSR